MNFASIHPMAANFETEHCEMRQYSVSLIAVREDFALSILMLPIFFWISWVILLKFFFFYED